MFKPWIPVPAYTMLGLRRNDGGFVRWITAKIA